MTYQDKIKIVQDLEIFISQKGSANKAAVQMPGVSTATISKMRNHEWDNIADEMFRKVGSYIGSNEDEWVYVETTRNAKEQKRLYSEAQKFKEVYGIIGKSGHGKTASSKVYEYNNKDVINISGTSYMDEKGFLSEILKKMGKESAAMTIPKMISKIVKEIKENGNILFMIQEFDKLSEKVLYLFISLYNELEDECGVVISATDYLEKKITKGIVLDKMGYREIFSRIGGKFIEIFQNDYMDTREICLGNGVNDEKIIRKIYDESKGDVRRIKRLVNAKKRELNEL